MEDIDASSLEVAKSSFLSLLSKIDPCESASFIEWVIQHCSNVNTTENTGETANYASMTSAEKRLTKIVKDIKKRVPLQGIMASENISHPEEGEVTYNGIRVYTAQEMWWYLICSNRDYPQSTNLVPRVSLLTAPWGKLSLLVPGVVR